MITVEYGTRTRPAFSAAALLTAGLLLTGCTPTGSVSADDAEASQQRTTASTTPAQSAQAAHVTAVIDGDTIRVRTDGRTERVRLLGINAPELAHDGNPEQCGGTAARTALDRLIWDQDVTLHTDPRADNRDRYGRLLRYVTAAGHDVGMQLIQAGRASAYYPASEPAPAKNGSYRAAQQAAEHARDGQWAHCTTAQEQKQ